MNDVTTYLRSLLAIAGLAVVVACSSAPPATPTGSPDASPTGSAGEPSATPSDGLPTPSSAPTSSPTSQPTPTSAPTPTAAPTPVAADVLRFRREQQGDGPRDTVDCTDPSFAGSIHLAWRVSGATGVTISIDGPGVFDSYPGKRGEADLPFACEEAKHTYTLTTTGMSGPPASVTRTFRRGRPAILDFAVIGPNCTDPAASEPVSVTWQIAYATGVEVWVDGALYATYSGRQSPAEGSSAGTFDCSKVSQEYTLVTTGGYGSPASLSLTALP